MDEINVAMSKSRQELKNIKEISGPGSDGKSKAKFMFRLLELSSDNTKNVISEIITDAPIVSVFKHAGAVNLYLDFGSANHPDCISLDKLLDEYYNPINHFPYLLEELESGKYLDGEDEEDIYFSALEVFITPDNSESEYKLVGYNPVFYSFEPASPQTKTPSIIQLTFNDDMFAVINKSDEFDIQELHKEVFQIIREEEIIKTLSEINRSTDEKKNDEVFINDISGYSRQTGRTKAHVVIRCVENKSDGTEEEIDTVHIDKPIVHIVQKDGYKELNLDFGSARDQDLQYIWKILKDYSAPGNSVAYTLDESESGVYNDGETDRLVYYPSVQVFLSPLGKESEYQIIGFNPLYYSLKPGFIPISQSDKSPEPSMLSFMFADETFVITTDLDAIDMNELQQEVLLSDLERNPYIY